MKAIRREYLKAAAAASTCAIALCGSMCARAETVTAEPDALLEYVEANGSQYIDTGVNAETGLKARLDFSLDTSVTSSSDWSILAAATASNVSDNRSRIFLCHYYGSGGKPFFGYGLKQRRNPSGSFVLAGGRRYEILCDMSSTNDLELVQNGKKTFSAADRETFATNGIVNLNLNLFIFACNYGGTPYWNSKGKLYELKIFKKNGEAFDLVRHYLPCIKDGRAGLYDKVNGTISYSFKSGSDFVAGPALDRPLDFVKWVWTDGNQYFDTWVWGKGGIRSEVDLSVRNYWGDHCILGARGGAGNTRLYPAYNYEGAFRYAYGTMPSTNDTTRVVPQNDVEYYMDTRYLFKSDIRHGYQSVTVSKNGGTPIELHKDGEAYLASSFVVTNTLALMACNNAGSYVYPSAGLVYRTTIWDGDELLRNFVPVVATNSEGVAYAGLYDTVTERIYRSVGTREFGLTNQVGCVTNSLRVAAVRPKTRLEYVDSDEKLDFVDLGIIAKDGLEMEAVMEWLRVPSDGAFVGVRLNDSHGAAHRFFLYHYWNSRHRLGYEGNLFEVNGSQPATANTKYRILTRLDVGQGEATFWTFADGEWGSPVTRTILPADGYGGPVDTGLPLYLFAVNLNGVRRFPGKVRLYSLKLRQKQQDGTYALVRDLVPVKDPATGAPVLWDRVSETYFRNAGKYLLAGGGAERPFDAGAMIIVR